MRKNSQENFETKITIKGALVWQVSEHQKATVV